MPTCLSTPTCTYRLPLVSFEWPSWSWIVYQGHGKTCPGHALSTNGAICNEAHCFIRHYLLLLYVVLCRKMVGRQAGRQDWCWKFMALSMTSFILVQCCVTKPSRVVVRWWWWRWWWWWWDDADDCPDFGVVSLEMTFTAPSIHPIIHPCIHASFHPSIHPSIQLTRPRRLRKR